MKLSLLNFKPDYNMEIKLRFNTENTTDLYWRLLINGEENLCSDVVINCPSRTTQDIIADGRTKFHITCDAKAIAWESEKKVVLS